MRRGHPSGAVWRYGMFLWPEAMVILPMDGPVVIVPVGAIRSVEAERDGQPVAGAGASGRVVGITAVGDDGDLVRIIVDDLGAMPAPHFVRTIETWRTGVEPELLSHADTAGRASRRR
jgi:hypothetical protein